MLSRRAYNTWLLVYPIFLFPLCTVANSYSNDVVPRSEPESIVEVVTNVPNITVGEHDTPTNQHCSSMLDIQQPLQLLGAADNQPSNNHNASTRPTILEQLADSEVDSKR